MMNKDRQHTYMYEGIAVAETDAELEEFFQILFEDDENLNKEEIFLEDIRGVLVQLEIFGHEEEGR